jgi:cell division protein FtsI (penicillin-binding protein 3)
VSPRPRDDSGRDRQLRLRRTLLLAFFGLGGVLVLGRAIQLQAMQGDRWAAEAADQQRERVPLPARRGAIYDRDGVPLALSYETFRVSIAPQELRDPKNTADQLVSSLGLSRARARSATSRKRKWVVLPGRFTVEQREALGDAPGLYFERRLERFYPQGNVGRELIGVVTRDGRALGGVEQEFDEQLRGRDGYSVLRRDAHGVVQPALSLPVAPPRDGEDVYLAIDFDLQEIADGALRSAIRSTGATGGDLVLLDPRTGEVLAAVSKRGGSATSLSAIVEPYEPGSTMKPFTAAMLLADHRAAPADRVYAEEGRWTTPEGRVITDSHPLGWVTLADVIRESSNIGMAKFSERLDEGRQYRYLRDFGFGTPTGVEFPAESGGRLRRPAQWSKLSQQSLAIGYEVSVTPLQLAAAYGALANGGVLMESHLLREIRSPDGEVLDRRPPRELRRVVPESVARQVTKMLVSVVEEGTATKAALENFDVAGKTGTARRTGSGGRYAAGSYTASFAGYFPADDPRIVIYVKLDNPQGSYYGGTTAAPVTRETLQGILAARSDVVSGPSLLATRAPVTAPELEAGPRAGTSREGPYVFSLADGVPRPPARSHRPVEVPPMAGLSLRDAARRAHRAGLRVRLSGSGDVVRTQPAAGGTAEVGDTILLVGGGE